MIYRLHGTIQPYAWGGHDYIPQLRRREPGNRLMTGCKKT